MMQIEELWLFITSLQWLRLSWLWWLAVLPVLGYWLAKRLSLLGKWSHWIKEPMLSLLVTKKRGNFCLVWGLVLFICLGILALLGPAQRIQNTTVQKNQTPLFIMLDLSLSMLSEDISPSRLEFIRYRITDMLRGQEDGLVSLIVYSGSAHIVTPLTEDIETILFQLPKLNPEIMPTYGSNPVEAISLIATSLEPLGNPSGRIIWLTDEAGEEDIKRVVQIAQAHSQEVVMIALGTPKGDVIPLSSGLLYDAENKPAISETPLTSMRALSQQYGVRFYSAKQLNLTLLKSLSTQFDVEKTPQQRQGDSQIKQWHELGYWLNIPLLFLLIFLMRSRLFS